MAKNKGSKSEGKQLAKKHKQEKQAKKQLVKKKKEQKKDDSDLEDFNLEAVLADYAKKQELFLKVTEAPCDPPHARSSSTLIASPSSDNEIFLFGGEYFNGSVATFFNDLYVYVINRDEWRLITSPNTPLPRSGHAWCRGGNSGGIYLYGGEFSSPKQGTFYHYNDFWRFEPSSREWSRIEAKGKSPSARSGHRMVQHKQYILLFAGFQDTSQQTKYLADLWIYDTQNFVWYNPTLPLATLKPEPRSSFTFLPHESGAVLYGGYSRVKATVTGKQTKGGGQAQRNVLRPKVHEDCFFLRIIQPTSDATPGTPPAVRWERRKKPANAPNPSRAGATMAYHKGRGIKFGGVHDVEESEEGIDSEFFNTLLTWNIERNRFFPLSLRKPRVGQRKPLGNERGGRKGRGQANEEELLRNLAALQTGKSLADADDMDIDKLEDELNTDAPPPKEILMEFPHPRFNAQLAVQGDQLFIYGGTFERGEIELTFDEMFSIDLGKLDGVKQIFRRDVENWLGSEDEDEDEDSGDEEENSEDEEDEEHNSEGDNAMTDVRLHTASKRKGKGKVVGGMTDIDDEEVLMADCTTFDDTSEDSSTATTEDTLPHPRPFESRRDFFQRTGNEWQEVLMTSLRWEGIQPETLSVKEIKTRAFEMSEEKWWDCREEISALEDEQEAAGIGEVLTLADRGETGGVGRRR